MTRALPHQDRPDRIVDFTQNYRLSRLIALMEASARVLDMFMNSTPDFTCAQRFHTIAEALCRAVANAIRPGFIQLAMAVLVTQRILRVRRVLLTLETRFLAGKRWQITRKLPPALAPDAVAEVIPRQPAVQTEHWPHRLGWLCPLVPSEAACFAGQMRAVLAETEMQALLAACPQAVRVLGPLCRMLGIARSEFVPQGCEIARVRLKRVRPKNPRPQSKAARLAAFDWAREDAHYAFTATPRRFRLRVV